MIKKIMYVVVVVVVLVGVLYKEHNYTMTDCIVTEATSTGCMIVDGMEQQWYYEGEGFAVGDVVTLEMYDNWSSAYLADDVIKEVVIQ